MAKLLTAAGLLRAVAAARQAAVHHHGCWMLLLPPPLPQDAPRIACCLPDQDQSLLV
jgi:hypothetical protein